MIPITLFADLSTRRLTGSSGTGSPSLPALTFGDGVTFSLRCFDRPGGGDLVEVSPAVRSLRASLGLVMTPPTGGTFKIKVGPAGTASAALAWNAGRETLLSVLAATAGMPSIAAVTSIEPGCWLVQFEDPGAIDLRTAFNSLDPISFVRIRAAQTTAGVWLHEIRLIQSPVAFVGSHEAVLADPPSVTRIRAGAERVPASTVNTNEVQALKVPTDFAGTYYLAWDYRSTRILGVEDGPEEIADALNAMFTDGLIRFAVTNPEGGTAYIEFIGELEAAPQDLITVTVQTFRPGNVRFALDLRTAELAAALRTQAARTLPFEIELTVVPTADDLGDPEAPTEVITLQAEVTVAREQIWDALAQVPRIDFLRPPSPRDYIPFTPDQVITGSQHFVAVFGDGVATSFVIDHGLGTEALHVSIRENAAPGALLPPSSYTIEITDEDSITITFADAPASDSLAVVITSAGPASAFQAHHHTIGQIDGLQDALDDLGDRLTAIENLLPTAPPSSADQESDGEAVSIEIPDADATFFPLLVGQAARVVIADPTKARAGMLLPAVHDSTVTDLGALPLPAAAGQTGQVRKNTTGSAILLPGFGGHRAASVPNNGFFASDGRGWYPVSRGPTASSNSFFPSQFERELFLFFVSAEMLPAGATLSLEFRLTLAALRANSRAHYDLVIELGAATKDTSPSPTDDNLAAITWQTTPLATQHLIGAELPVTHRLGARIARSAAGVFSSDRLVYGRFLAGAAVPDQADFVVRGRLVRFDTENAVTDARGIVQVQLREARAFIA